MSSSPGLSSFFYASAQSPGPHDRTAMERSQPQEPEAEEPPIQRETDDSEEPQEPPKQQSEQQPPLEPQPDNTEHNVPEGGRLWTLAGQEATKLSILMDKTRSRAVPHANVHYERKTIVNGTVRMNDNAILMNTGPAHVRVKVVQMLVVGCVGLLGWLGHFGVTNSCHFATVYQPVGSNGNLFALHYGLYKYSPADAALSGFTYCQLYDGTIGVWLILGRILDWIALILGTFALIILWWYLITGKCRYWKYASSAAWVAGVAQVLVMMSLMEWSVGRLGPASWGTIFTGCAWMIVAWEMNHLVPVDNTVSVTSLEMADVKMASRHYMERAWGSTPPYRPPEVVS